MANAITPRGPCMLYFRRSIYIWIDEKHVKICEKPQLRRLKTNGSFRLGGLSQRAKGASYHLVTNRDHNLGGWVGQIGDILANKLLISSTGQPRSTVVCSLRDQQAFSPTQARLVSRLCGDRLPVIVWLKELVYFLEKWQARTVKLTPFSLI